MYCTVYTVLLCICAQLYILQNHIKNSTEHRVKIIFEQIKSGLITATLVALIMSGVGVLWAYLDTSGAPHQPPLYNITASGSDLSVTVAAPLFSNSSYNNSSTQLNSNNSWGPSLVGPPLSTPPHSQFIDDLQTTSPEVSSRPLSPPPTSLPHPLLFGAVIFVGAWISMMVSTVNGASTPILVSENNFVGNMSICTRDMYRCRK
jgi:hypothetical protein